MSLVLKSNKIYTGPEMLEEFYSYVSRVVSDGGEIADPQALREAFEFARSQAISSSNVFSATSARWGVKMVGGSPVKLYSLFSSLGDVVVTGAMNIEEESGFLSLRNYGSGGPKALSEFHLNSSSLAICLAYKSASATGSLGYLGEIKGAVGGSALNLTYTAGTGSIGSSAFAGGSALSSVVVGGDVLASVRAVTGSHALYLEGQAAGSSADVTAFSARPYRVSLLTNVDGVGPVNGWLREAWALSDASAAQVLALSQRLADIYGDVA